MGWKVFLLQQDLELDLLQKQTVHVGHVVNVNFLWNLYLWSD